MNGLTATRLNAISRILCANSGHRSARSATSRRPESVIDVIQLTNSTSKQLGRLSGHHGILAAAYTSASGQASDARIDEYPDTLRIISL